NSATPHERRLRSSLGLPRPSRHPLPARLVDGGVCLPVLVLVAFKAERIEYFLRLFDVLDSQDAAGMTPPLRILPRRFEGGEQCAKVAKAQCGIVAGGNDVAAAGNLLAFDHERPQPLDRVVHFPSSWSLSRYSLAAANASVPKRIFVVESPSPSTMRPRIRFSLSTFARSASI